MSKKTVVYNPEEKKQQIKNICITVRALINSKKPPFLLRQLNSDYLNVNEEPIPYRSLGFNSVEELLRSTGEFDIYGTAGETYISAKYNAKTAHINELVRNQKTDKCARRGGGGGRRPNIHNDQSWNKSSFSKNVYSNLTNRRPPSKTSLPRRAPFTAGDRNNNCQPQISMNKSANIHFSKRGGSGSNVNFTNSIIQRPLSSNNEKQQNLRTANSNTENNNVKRSGDLETRVAPKVQSSIGLPKPDLSKRLQIIQQKTVDDLLSKEKNATEQLKIQVEQTGKNNPQKQNANNSQRTVQTLQISNTITKSQSQPGRQPQPIVQPTFKSTITPTHMPTLVPAKNTQHNTLIRSKSVQERLNTTATHRIPLTEYQKNNIPKLPAPDDELKYWGTKTDKMDPISELAAYCLERNYPPPEYSFITTKYAKNFQCRVDVNRTVYSTYPEEYPSQYESRFHCAKKALNAIRTQESRRPLRVCTDSEDELLEKLYCEVLAHPYGMFVKNVPEWFESTFQQLLPENWWTLVQLSNKFKTEQTTQDIIIIHGIANPISEKSRSCDDINSVGRNMEENAIILPWQQKHWNIYITYCKSTVEIYGRLYGTEYNDSYNDLLDDMKQYMKTGNVRPCSIKMKEFYLVAANPYWHRVRIEDIDKTNGNVLAYYIDFGDSGWLSVNQLYECEQKFLKLPAQAVAFSLFGLEDFAGNPVAPSILKTMVSKSLVGEILTKETEYYDANSNGKIQIVLYDTSSDEDINMHPMLLEKICKATPVPQFTTQKTTSVIVTHISDSGDVYVQFPGEELKYMQKLIQQLIESKFNRDNHKVTLEDLKRSKLFLICDDTDRKGETNWYRGALLNNHFDVNTNVFDIFYVDFGMTRNIHISKIFCLESLSTALSRCPPQALKTRLYNIPESYNVVGRLRAILPANREALAKLVKSEGNQIMIYKRHEENGILCTVNDTIRIEYEEEMENSLKFPNANNVSGKPLSITIPSNTAEVKCSGENFTNTGNHTDMGSIINMAKNLSINSPQSLKKGQHLPKLKDYFLNIGVDFVEIRITMCSNPSSFMFQPYAQFNALRDLMVELQGYCQGNDEYIPADMIELGQAYAARNADGFYHRVIAYKYYAENMIYVKYCDFGDGTVLDCKELKTLPLKFRHLPKMALDGKMYGITAPDGGTYWNSEDCQRFRDLTVGQKFCAYVRKITFDKTQGPYMPIYELELVDVSTSQDIYLQQVLLEEKLAIEDVDEKPIWLGVP